MELLKEYSVPLIDLLHQYKHTNQFKRIVMAKLRCKKCVLCFVVFFWNEKRRPQPKMNGACCLFISVSLLQCVALVTSFTTKCTNVWNYTLSLWCMGFVPGLSILWIVFFFVCSFGIVLASDTISFDGVPVTVSHDQCSEFHSKLLCPLDISPTKSSTKGHSYFQAFSQNKSEPFDWVCGWVGFRWFHSKTTWNLVKSPKHEAANVWCHLLLHFLGWGGWQGR